MGSRRSGEKFSARVTFTRGSTRVKFSVTDDVETFDFCDLSDSRERTGRRKRPPRSVGEKHSREAGHTSDFLLLRTVTIEGNVGLELRTDSCADSCGVRGGVPEKEASLRADWPINLGENPSKEGGDGYVGSAAGKVGSSEICQGKEKV